MQTARDEPFRSSLSDVPIGPSDARDESSADASDEIAALEQRARDSLAALQAHLGSLRLPDVGSDPDTRSGEWRRFDRNDYIRLLRREDRFAPGFIQALVCGGSWVLSGLAVAPLGLLLAGLEPSNRMGDPVLLEAVQIFDEPAAAFLGSIVEAGEATLTAAPALAGSRAVRATESAGPSVVEGARAEPAVSVGSVAPVAKAADQSRPKVAPVFTGSPAARAVAPDGMRAIEVARPELAVLPAFGDRAAGAAIDLRATVAPAGSPSARPIRPDRMLESAQPEPVASRAVAAPLATPAADDSHAAITRASTGSVAAAPVAPDRGSSIARARTDPALALASPAPVATAVKAAALAVAPVPAGSTTARSVKLDDSNPRLAPPAQLAALAVVAEAATREESDPSVATAAVSPPAARAIAPDRAIVPVRTRASGPRVLDSIAAEAISPDGDSAAESGRPQPAGSPGLAAVRTPLHETHPVLPTKLEHPIVSTAEPTVSPLRPVAVGGQAVIVEPAMDSVPAVSDAVILPALATFDAPIGDHDRLVATVSRGADTMAGPASASDAARAVSEPNGTTGPDDAAHDLKLAAPPGPMASLEAESAHPIDETAAGTPVSMLAALTSPRLLAEQVMLPPELVLTQGETTIRLASGASSASLQPGIYEAVIEWGGAQLPIAPLVVGKEPVEIAFRIEPSTVTLRFDGVAAERVSWTIRRSEGGTLRLRGPVVSESLPPGNYTIEAEIDGELRRHPLKVGVGEAHTIVAR
jgi:hypothetical protein